MTYGIFARRRGGGSPDRKNDAMTTGLRIPDKSIINERRAFYTTVVFAVLILIALWSFVAVTTTKTREEDQANSARVLERMTYSVEEQARRMFKIVEIFLVSVDHWMRQNPAGDPRHDPRFGAMMRDFRQATGGIIHVSVVDAEGRAFSVSDEPEQER